MAEENEIPFSPLDSLGPQFGNIDPVNTNPASYEPWENTGPIMNEDFNVPVAPNPGTYQPHVRIRKDVVGKPDQRPPITKPKNARSFNDRYLQIQKDIAGLNTNADLSDKNRIYAYNDGPNGDAFYDRYAAYGAEKLADIGFHPFRDNEAVYNKRTTGWNDFSRMMSNSFLPLAARGFISGPKSLYRIITDFDFSEDKEDAEIYERAAAIGQSSRGGLGSFLNNTMMNFGYTAGIMTEALVEEAALVALAPQTFGGSLAGTIGVGAKTIKGVSTAFDLAGDVNKTLQGLNNYNKAKNFWTGTKTGRFLNPIENVTDANAVIKANNLSGLAAGKKYFGGFYRDVRNINMALAEARLEGGFVSNSVQDRLTNDYYAANGELPSDEMQYDFAKQAKKASTRAMQWNTALIYGSNKITFPNIMRPRGGIKSFLASRVDDIKTFKNGKIVYERAKDGAKGEFKFIENNLKNTLKSFYKDPLGKSLRGGLGYFKANIMEGFQEVGQEIISEAYQNYYVDAFKQKNRAAFHYGEGITEASVLEEYFMPLLDSEAIGKQFSAQGFETFASGFFMGMFAKPFNAAIPALSTGYNKYFGDTAKYNEYKEIRNSYGEAAAQALNNLYADPAKLFDSRLFNYSLQNALSEVGADGTTKEIADANDAAVIQQVLTSLEHGTFDVFTDHLESFKELSLPEFEEAFGFQPGTGQNYKQKIDNVVEKSKRIKQRYDFYKERFPNPVKLEQFDDTDSLEYSSAALLKKAWDVSLSQAVFLNESFEDVSSRLVELSNKLTTDAPLKNITSTDVQVLLNNSTANNQIELLKGQIKALEGTPDSETKIKAKKKELKSLENFQEAKDRFKKYFYPERYDEKFKEELREKGIMPEGTEEGGLSVPLDIAREDIDIYIKQTLGERTEENDAKEISNFKKSYEEYIKSIGEGEVFFDSKLDSSFEDLIDYYKLQDEAETFVYYTNILHNPQGFIEQVKKNEGWMTKIYENRKSYFTDMVESAMSDREQNAILNSLANENIFIDAEQFRNFMKDGVEPEEFFDNTTKQAIPKDTNRYNFYLNRLYEARKLSDKTDIEEIEEASALTDKIDLINKRRQKELSYIKGETVEELAGSIIPTGQNPSFRITRIMKESLPGDRIVATIAGKKQRGEMEFFNEDGVIVDSNGERIESGSMRKLSKKYPAFSSASIYRTNVKVDQNLIDQINQKYDNAIDNLVKNFAQYQKEDTQDYMSNPTREKLKALDRNLYNEIEELYKAEYGEQEAELEDQVQKDNLFNSFVKENKKARGLIEKFFDKVDEAAEVTVEEEVTVETPVAKSESKIIQSIEPTIETKDNITFGTAGQVGENKNEDAVYVDTENGLYILADGMGGMGRVTTQSPEQAASDIINTLKGTPVKTGTELLYEEFQKNPEMTVEEAMDFLGIDKNAKRSYLVKDSLSYLLAGFKGAEFTKTSDDKGYNATTTGAVTAVAKRVAPNKYEIEKVGDTVFFVVDKNGKVIQSHGLSTSATVDEAYIFSVKDGKPQMNSPKVDKFTIELKDGQTLVLATDFIETEKAMDDFIKTDFGKNINFTKFQEENKPDDSSFIVIREEVTKEAPAPLEGDARERFFEDTRNARIRELEKTIRILEGETQSKEKELTELEEIRKAVAEQVYFEDAPINQGELTLEGVADGYEVFFGESTLGDTQESKLGLREDVINGKKVYSIVAKTFDRANRPATYSISLSYPENTNFNQDEVKKINAKLTAMNNELVESAAGRSQVLLNLNIKRADGEFREKGTRPNTYMRYITGGNTVTKQGFKYRRDEQSDADIAVDPVKIAKLSEEITNLKSRLKDSKAELKDLQSEIKTETVEEIKEADKADILKDLSGDQRRLTKEFIKKIERASTEKALQELNGEILYATDITQQTPSADNITSDTANKLYALVQERMSQVSTGEVTGVAGEAVNVGDNLVVINSDKGREGVKINKSTILPVGASVKVVKTDENSVTLNAGLGENSVEYNVSFDKLKKSYELQNKEYAEQETPEMTEEDKKFQDESIDTAAEFKGNQEKIENAENNDGSIEDIDDSLMEDLDC